jgi:nitroimidazol reductase NimA-like FMN-containing flavoprotein (pyridoxamine 5'-phosphate oxidase superfamily)
MTTLVPLPAHECERLLRAAVFGRVVLPTPGRTEVFPINYAVMGDAVLVRTTPGSLLDRHADGAALVLEVDEIDHERWQGWSVVARGTGQRLEERQLTIGERCSPGPPPWVSGRDVWIRLRWDEISGRKVGAGELAQMSVRRAWR